MAKLWPLLIRQYGKRKGESAVIVGNMEFAGKVFAGFSDCAKGSTDCVGGRR